MRAKNNMRNVLVLGIGNLLQKDDGIGVHIVNYLTESGIAFPEGVEVMDGGTAGFDLIPLMAGRDKIIIVDALHVDDKPGSIYRFTPEHLVESRERYSLHDLGVKEIIKQLNLGGHEPDIEIIGIVPEDIHSLEIGISDSLKKSLPLVAEQIVTATTL